MQCWDHFRRWKGAPHGSKLFWRFGVSIFHVNNDRDIFGPGLCSMSFFLGYVFLKECSHWAVSWVRFFFSKLGRICLRIFFKSQPRWGWLQPPIKDNFNKVSIFFDCTRTLETKISFFFFANPFIYAQVGVRYSQHHWSIWTRASARICGSSISFNTGAAASTWSN